FVGRAAHQAIGIGAVRLAGEVVHLVVEQKAGTGHDPLAAIGAVQGGGQRHRVAILVHHREMGGLRAFRRPAAGTDIGTVAGAPRVEVGEALPRVVLRGEHGGRYLDKVGVTQVFGAVGV